MTPDEFDILVRFSVLLFVLLNPFFISIYLLDLFQEMAWRPFVSALTRGSAISAFVFILFAGAGDALFSRILQVRFASFQIFGGVVFLILAVRFFFTGTDALRELRGAPRQVVASIAMPTMIGPGTISASVLAGGRLPFGLAVLAIVAALSATIVILTLLKLLYDFVHIRHEAAVQHYVDITGRAMSLVTGTIAIEMIVRGIETHWRAMEF